MKNKNIMKLLTFALVLCMAVALTGCGQATPTTTTTKGGTTTTKGGASGWDGTFDGTIKVGAVGPLSGPSAESGKAAQQGQELAVAEWNAKGGLKIDDKYYEIKLLYEDSTGTPEVAVAAAEKLLSVDKVEVIFAETLISSCILPTMDLCAKYPDVVFSTIEGVSTAIPAKFAQNPSAYFNFFKAAWSSDTYGKNVADGAMYLVDEGIIQGDKKTVAYVVEDTDYGRSNANAAEEVFAGYGWTTVAYEVSPAGNTDFYSQINKIMELDPDIVVSCFVPVASGIAYLKQVQELGVDWSDIAIVYPTKPGFYEDTGSACKNLFWTPIEFNTEAPEIKDFAAKIKDMFNVSLTKCQLSGYEVTNMMFQAIEKAGTTNAKDGLAETYGASQYKSLLGTYAFDENHCAKSGEDFLHLALGQVQSDAQTSLIVWPESMQQTKPVPQR